MTLLHKHWMELQVANEKRSAQREGTKAFAITNEQVDAVDDTAGLPPVRRAGKARADEHVWNNQF